jgi:hypothetical protein
MRCWESCNPRPQCSCPCPRAALAWRQTQWHRLRSAESQRLRQRHRWWWSSLRDAQFCCSKSTSPSRSIRAFVRQLASSFEKSGWMRGCCGKPKRAAGRGRGRDHASSKPCMGMKCGMESVQSHDDVLFCSILLPSSFDHSRARPLSPWAALCPLAERFAKRATDGLNGEERAHRWLQLLHRASVAANRFTASNA